MGRGARHRETRRRAAAAAAAAAKLPTLNDGHRGSLKPSTSDLVAVPNITESDLLAFQLSHFGDETRPETWFVEGEVALSYEPAHNLEEAEGDDLGYYEDGVKRTLTDEQIEMFRHSETQQLIARGLLAREEGDSSEDVDRRPKSNTVEPAPSPVSSIEGELLDMPAAPLAKPPIQKKSDKQPSPSIRSNSTSSSAAKRLQRETEVPYDQRKKRKWEGYIEDIDPEHGSRTHRRIIRELDEQGNSDVELEY